MAGQSLRRHVPLLSALGALFCLALPSLACPFCSMQGQTLTGEVSQAAMLLTSRSAKPERYGI